MLLLACCVAASLSERTVRGDRGFRYRGGSHIYAVAAATPVAPVAPAATATADTALASSVSFDPSSNVCLLTIMTQERTASLHRMLTVWDGYVSIALLVDSYDEASPEGIGLLRYHGVLPLSPQRITLSIVEDRGYRSPHNRFPYNVLRNIALEGCISDYVMAADVDFVPYPLRPSAILRKALVEHDVRDGARNVLVLAAFEEVEQPRKSAQSRANATDPTATYPKPTGRRLALSRPAGLDKAELVRRVRAGQIVGFASREYDAGHRCDHVNTFLMTSASYRVEYEFGCEPYTVLPRAMAHQYEERFVGYGKDRVSWNYELAARGAVFHVPADIFLIHFNTYDEDEIGRRPKKKYGHFPNDWMLGESCWPAFRDRVQNQYNYSLYTCHQNTIDGLCAPICLVLLPVSMMERSAQKPQRHARMSLRQAPRQVRAVYGRGGTAVCQAVLHTTHDGYIIFARAAVECVQASDISAAPSAATHGHVVGRWTCQHGAAGGLSGPTSRAPRL